MLVVHRAERTDRLAEALADMLAEPGQDPFAAEIVCVPSRGVERWLAQRLSNRLGVCANVLFPSVDELMARLGAPEPLSAWPVLELTGGRYATARRIADLFTSYRRHRPEMVRAWEAGEYRDVPDDLRWQPELWRRLEMPRGAARGAARGDDLPARLSLFGPTRLAAAEIALLKEAAADRDVHLWLAHPSPAMWDKPEPDHPLLASLGREVRELQLTLGAATSIHHPGTPAPPTLLGALQRSIIADDPLALTDSDQSLQVHACHGPERQVEVLREVVLALLEADPTLEPRDMLVMCPDIETFAPLISASFGLGAEAAHPAHRLRVRLADRALRQLNPLFGLVAHLLELADARVTAAQVLDVAGLPAVRRKFGFDDDDLERLRDLVAGSGVRWGFDTEHRRRFLVTVRPNTWEAGLDRILLGAAMSEEGLHWLGTALPLDDVDSGDVELAGRLAEFVERLRAALDGFARPSRKAITDAVDALAEVPDADAWQRASLDRELAELDDVPVTLDLADVRSVLADRLRGSPTRAGFRTGDLTMCTMVPMRSVPHRVICVLGLDDGVFPRNAVPDGDDVLARDRRPGERDPRAEDRQLLLDAVMAATETLVLLYAGADERTNASRPPAVPLAELLDALGPAGGSVVTRHPLQPFDPRNFAGERPFSFDRVAWAGAVAAAGSRSDPPPFLCGPLSPLATDISDLGDLCAFFTHPVRTFARRRLGVGFPGDGGEPDDGLPVELDALQKWSVGDRLLRSLLDGTDLDRCVQAEWRRGVVPPGPLGARVLEEIAGEVRPLAEAASAHVTGVPRAVDVTVTLPDGRQLSGTVGDVHDDTAVAVFYSRVAPKHRLRAWLDLLALSAARPEIGWRTVAVGRGMRGRPARSTFGPIGAAEAVGLLADLVAFCGEGLCEPLPMAAKASYAYAVSRLAGGSAETAAEKARDQWSRFEADDEAYRLVWGPGSPVDMPGFEDLALRLWEPLCRAETSEQL